MTSFSPKTNKSSWNLEEISSWQLIRKTANVELPSMQRGFVWKVNQIEALWDSLLRGFPIGSFLLYKEENEDNEVLFLMDGQQRATAIAFGFYDPWNNPINTKIGEEGFWSLKTIPTVWIDLLPKQKTNTQNFVLRVVTQSHPWGYQRVNNVAKLSVPDRRNALEVLRKNEYNKDGGYTQFNSTQVFPFDADIPVPLTFLIKSIHDGGTLWKEHLIKLCSAYLPSEIVTKPYLNDSKSYIERLSKIDFNSEELITIYTAVENLSTIEVPYIVIKKKILMETDEQSGLDPTLFVRLNSYGTNISGEELIYSIYKASFPDTKELVENIGMNFIAPSLVISLSSRIVQSLLEKERFPQPMTIKEFQKKIKYEEFRNVLNEFIGKKNNSPASNIFSCAIDLLRSESEFKTPTILIKKIIKESPELFLLLLFWLHSNNNKAISQDIRRKILATITALSWFGRNNNKYVSLVWDKIHEPDFWSKNTLSIPFLGKKDFIMYPLIQPEILRDFLILKVIDKRTQYNLLYPDSNSSIATTYINALPSDIELQETEILINDIWNNFRFRLKANKSILLFAQRQYINEEFFDFNQFETLEDTHTPWDWDHIYPSSWVYYQQNIDQLIRDWSYSIGNLRALSLEVNRSEGVKSPQSRLVDENVRQMSFINDDWQYWKQIGTRINEGMEQEINIYLNATINRFVNIYKEWYDTLDIGDLFNY